MPRPGRACSMLTTLPGAPWRCRMARAWAWCAGLWKAYLGFYETVLPDEVYASTWSRLLDAGEPSWGALALQDGTPVGLVHWLYPRTNWSIADNCYLQDLFVAPDGRGQGHGR